MKLSPSQCGLISVGDVLLLHCSLNDDPCIVLLTCMDVNSGINPQNTDIRYMNFMNDSPMSRASLPGPKDVFIPAFSLKINLETGEFPVWTIVPKGIRFDSFTLEFISSIANEPGPLSHALDEYRDNILKTKSDVIYLEKRLSESSEKYHQVRKANVLFADFIEQKELEDELEEFKERYKYEDLIEEIRNLKDREDIWEFIKANNLNHD